MSYVDINDMQMEAEEAVLDANADPFAPPAPPPDGEYTAKLFFQEKDSSKRWQVVTDDNGKVTSLWMKVEARISGGDYDGRPVFGLASTRLNKNGTSVVAGIVKAAEMGDLLTGVSTHQAQAQLAEKALAGEPLVKIKIQWQANAKDGSGKYKTYVRGMRNFPQRGDTYNHIVRNPDTGEDVVAQAVILSYRPLSA